MTYHCINHPDRPAVVDDICWECYLGKEVFEKRFGKDFYEKQVYLPAPAK